MPTDTDRFVDRARFVDYFRELGKHPLEAGGLVWFESGPAFYQSFPFHVVQPADDVPLRELFSHPRVLSARFAQCPAPGHEVPQRSALWIRRTPYSLDELSSNTRSKIRRGLKSTRVERIDFATLRERGIPLVQSTAVRQRMRFGDRQAHAWDRMCSVAEQHPIMEVWGAFVDDVLAAFAICFHVEDCFQISTVRSDSQLLSSYPNNALIHTLLDDGLRRPGVASVCYGLASLDRGTGGLNDFKRSVGFEAENVDDMIVGRLPVLAARAGGALLGRLAPRSHRLAQFATIAKTISWWRHQR